MNPVRRPSSGLTLIELMVTIALVAILAPLASPAIGTFASRSAMRSISTDFSLALQRGRMEAATKNSCVSVCMSGTVGAADPKCTDAGTDWNGGWIAYINNTCAAPTTADPTVPGNIVLLREAGSSRYTLSNLSGNTDLRAVTFTPRGMTTTSSTVGFQLNDTAGNAETTMNRTICMDPLGRVRLVSGTTC